MRLHIVLAFAVTFLATLAAPLFAGDLYVSTEQVNIETKSALFSMPVEVQRGQVWEVLKRTDWKVIITFGPDDPRLAAWKANSLKPPKYVVKPKVFDESFVPIDEWGDAKQEHAISICQELDGYAAEDCLRIADGEVWIGMTVAAAELALEGKIHRRRTRETADGIVEIWDVGDTSAAAVGMSAAVSTVHEGTVNRLIDGSGPSESIESRADRWLEKAISMTLEFKDGAIVSIERVENN